MPDNQQQRTVADLDADKEVFIRESRNRCAAHIEPDCYHVDDNSKPRRVGLLHQDLRICKQCDPDYQVDRTGGGPGLRTQLPDGDPSHVRDTDAQTGLEKYNTK